MDSALTYKLLGIGAYLAILVGIGVVASRRMKDLRDYFAGGKKLGFLSIAFSARATGESAWLLLGLTGMGAALGVRGFWVVLGEVLGVGAAWLFMSRRFKRLTDLYDSVTVPDYLESRFRDTGHKIRIVSAFALVAFVTVYVSAQIDATGQAFESFVGWNYYVGALVGFAVVLVYVTCGGFVAVVWSDLFQGLMMVLGLAALPIVAYFATEGWGAVGDGLRAIDPNLLSWTGGQPLNAVTIATILSLVLIGLGFLGSPQIFVRFLALKSENEIPRGTAVALIWTVVADSGAVCIGILGRYLLTEAGGETVLDADGENVLPELAAFLLHPVLVGVYIAVVLAATMSTVDSLLVVASSALVRDVHQKIFHKDISDERLLTRSRWTTVTIAAFAFLVAMAVALLTETRSIFWFVVFGWSGIAATFCPTIILSLFWTRCTARGALAAMISGFACVPIFKFAVPIDFFVALGELAPAFVISIGVGIVVSLLDRRGQQRVEAAAEEMQVHIYSRRSASTGR